MAAADGEEGAVAIGDGAAKFAVGHRASAIFLFSRESGAELRVGDGIAARGLHGVVSRCGYAACLVGCSFAST